MNRQWHRHALVLLVLVATAPQGAWARTLLEAGNSTTWRYLDGGVAPPARWTQQSFDDSQWKTGTAPLGYGEPRLVTELRKEGANGKQAVTAWFRCEFKPPKLAAGESLVVSTCVDDGAVIYLNGQEACRVNMPRGPVTPKTFASQTLGDSEE
ncbi:MAG TPA: hypothetical protein VHV77_16940, partial [Pirellulales bacterium]|nr:hypothetical protein [Pirellulales bacterium]